MGIITTSPHDLTMNYGWKSLPVASKVSLFHLCARLVQEGIDTKKLQALITENMILPSTFLNSNLFQVNLGY